MDTMTSTKVVAALCGAFLVFLLGKWAAEVIYHVDGHGEQAYVIDTGASESAAEEKEPVDFGPILAAADVAKGASVFKKCGACHKLEAGANGTGPTLHNVVGRPVGAEPGFKYSGAMASAGGTWTPEHLNEFLTNPKAVIPGTAMGFAGLKKIEERADVIAYIQSVSN
ncbi:c-type cytochrome [Seohaeicola zhoushanensis]|uniref:Cytochrome c n=1 Tax=Seohaeicola zhoushanensis TaxID=1569283 RepID=A0A8J3GUT1_9RHOB|nr:cytochrome c family protein [Seohaeicola zhoushanensis]GHF37141.1 cytochrome c [Seohaeicola zhoushanensis]